MTTNQVIVVAEVDRKVVIVRPETTQPIVTQPSDTLALIAVQRGPKGDPGDADPTYVASGSLSAHRVVRVIDGSNHVAYAQPTLNGVMGIVGITLQSAIVNGNITVRRDGEITDPSFTFTAGQAIYLTSNGFMTQVVPSSGVIQRVGYAITTTTMAVSIESPIAL